MPGRVVNQGLCSLLLRLFVGQYVQFADHHKFVCYLLHSG